MIKRYSSLVELAFEHREILYNVPQLIWTFGLMVYAKMITLNNIKRTFYVAHKQRVPLHTQFNFTVN